LREADMAEDVSIFRVTVTSSTDPMELAPTGWIVDGDHWQNISDGRLYERSGSKWVEVPSLPEHSHPELGDVKQLNLVEKFTINGDEPYTGEIEISKVKTLVFNKGVIVKFG
jgi:hypothetical protein